MGTSYTFDGQISISPPLNYAEILKAREVAMGMLRSGFDAKHATPEHVFEGYMPLKPDLTESTEITDRGPLAVTEAPWLVPSHPSEGSLSYSMVDLVKALAKALPNHDWHGEVTALQNDREHAYKLVTDKEGVREVKGVGYIEWGDDSESTPIVDLL